jgi:hypothetical protein
MRAHRLTLFACAAAVLATACARHRRAAVPIEPPVLAPGLSAVLWSETFEDLRNDRWREVEVHGRSEYGPIDLDGRRCLRARSDGGASILLGPMPYDPNEYPWISWDWRVDTLPEGEDLRRKEGSDAAARVYVYFETGGLPWQKRSLDYVRSATLPPGTVLDSAFSPDSKIIVVESGPDALGQWRTAERNLRQDYERSFGRGPVPRVVAIGLMTDSDNTGGETLAHFDDVTVSRVPMVDANAVR